MRDIHTAVTAGTVDLGSNPLHILKSVTDYNKCHYTGELKLKPLIGYPIANHMYECFMAEVGDPRTYKEAMKIPDAKQWLNSLSVLGSSVHLARYPMGPRKL